MLEKEYMDFCSIFFYFLYNIICDIIGRNRMFVVYINEKDQLEITMIQYKNVYN